MDPDKLSWQLKFKQCEHCLNQQPELCAVWKGQQPVDEGKSVSFQKELSKMHWLLAFFLCSCFYWRRERKLYTSPASNLTGSQLSNKKHLYVKKYTGLVGNCQKAMPISLPPDLLGDVNPCNHVAFPDKNLQ